MRSQAALRRPHGRRRGALRARGRAAWHRRRRRRRVRPRPQGHRARLAAASEWRPATTGASSSSWIRLATDVTSPVGFTPPGPKTSSAQTDSTGVDPIDCRRSRAVSTAASALTANRTRSTSRTASSFVGPGAPERRCGLARALGVARADHDVDARVHEPLRDRAAEAPRPTDDRDLHAAASSTVFASRREAARSVISVCVTTRAHRQLSRPDRTRRPRARRSGPRSRRRRVRARCRRPCGRAYGLPGP